MKQILLYCCMLLLWVTPSHATTSMFTVQCKGTSLYLGGTIHILKEDDFPLPDTYQEAYQKADTLVFETDMAAMRKPAMMGKMLTAMQYQDKRTLQTVLQKETSALLAARAKALDIDLKTLNGFKPAALVTMMMAMELRKLGVKEGGVDSHFFTQSILDDKKTMGLESIDIQLKTLAAMGEGEEDALIRSSIEDFDHMRDRWAEMIQAWRTGNLDQMEQEFIAPLKEHPAMYQSMLVDRNQLWIPQIMKLFDNDQIELILVGAAHLVGKDGLLQQLEMNGCVTQQM